MKVIRRIFCVLFLFVLFIMFYYIFSYNIYKSLYKIDLDIDYTSILTENSDDINQLSSNTLSFMINDVFSKTIKGVIFNENSITDEYISTLVDNNMDKLIEELDIDSIIDNTLGSNIGTSIEPEIKEMYTQKIKSSVLEELIKVKDEIKKSISTQPFEILAKVFSDKNHTYICFGLVLLMVLISLLSIRFKGIMGCGIVSMLSSISFFGIIRLLFKMIVSKLPVQFAFVSDIFATINQENFSYCMQFFVFGFILLLLYFVVYKIIKNKQA